jgi:serine/threonine-protein kinase
MSPEQADFQVTDKRSDLFSLGVVLSTLLLGENIFKGENPEKSRDRIMSMPIPDFRKLDRRVDDKLNSILQRALARDLKQRYPVADEMLYELEYYIYHSGYGPTNETLGKFVRDLFGLETDSLKNASKGSTRLVERTARTSRTTTTRSSGSNTRSARNTRTTRNTRSTKKTILIR